MNTKLCIEHIKNKFISNNKKVEIKNLRGGAFTAKMVDDGIMVDNLGSDPFLPWTVFEEALNAMLALGGTAQKGNAMNSKYGDIELRFESVEGRIAKNVYRKKEGDSVTRRITPIASILIWTGLCENFPAALRLNKLGYFDERSFKKHYNYFIALESDVNAISRYIELDKENFDTYSIQLAHLFLSISSEADVVLKLLCKEIENDSKPRNILDYYKIITRKYNSILTEPVHLNRYDLTFAPWHNWREKAPPNWWSSYNKVKHTRDMHFKEANLINVLNSICGLFIALFYLRKAQIEQVLGIFSDNPLDSMQPDPILLRLESPHYMFRSDPSRIG